MALKIYNVFLMVISICSLFFRKKRTYIVFESCPDYAGSPKMVCLEMENRGFRKNFDFVWAINKNQKIRFKDYKCIPFWGKLNFFERLKKNLIVWNAALIVDSNRAILKQNKKTFRLYTNHGAPLKNCFEATKLCGKMDYTLALSERMADEGFRMYNGWWVSSRNQFVELGYPSNDELFKPFDLSLFWKKSFPSLNMKNFSKIIGWFPTFRQRNIAIGDDSISFFPYGIPLVKNERDLSYVNGFLKEKNVLLVLQIHHAQKKTFEIVNVSNIVVLNQNIKDELGVTNANLMQNFDALITDYSSAYHEYIMLDRPIAVSIDDYEDYASHMGFCVDFFEYIKGVYLKNVNDLVSFINDVAKGFDSAKKERHCALHKIHKYVDALSTQRVVDFICDKACLNKR